MRSPAALASIYETLLQSALDEVTSGYGLIAEAVSYPDDYSSASYKLRAEAKWHDDSPITPDDVIFSFEAFKKYSPQLAAYYRHVAKVEKTGDREITFSFDAAGNRELPQIVGELTILPKAWWEGTDQNGKKRNIGETTLEPPLGSGAYRLKEFSPGRSLVYERVPDYWGKALNVNIGVNNFDTLRHEYFRDTTVALEAFKGDAVDWRTENSAKNWATAYDFPAVTEKRVVLEEFPINSFGVMQAFAFNIRRAKFQDPRVRRAFNYAFDFEEMNRQIFFGQYSRIASYFQGTELACSGVPSGRELELLEGVRDKVPPELFTAPYTNPIGGYPEAVRNNLREAIRLFKEAGYEIQNQKLIDTKSGCARLRSNSSPRPTIRASSASFCSTSRRSTGSASPCRYAPWTTRNTKTACATGTSTSSLNAWGESLSPGNEQRGYWGSQAADQPGSLNLIGIKNPAIDAMIDAVIFAKSRDDLVVATHALDRVLLWNNYVVPQWTYGKVRSARWDRFGRPEAMPKYGAAAFPTVWWWDADKAAKAGSKS